MEGHFGIGASVVGLSLLGALQEHVPDDFYSSDLTAVQGFLVSGMKLLAALLW